MRFDSQTIMMMQRKAYDALTSNEIAEKTRVGAEDQKPVIQKSIKVNKHYVPPKLTTSPAMLIQELPWINTATSFTFDFSQNAPPQVPNVNNNIVIDKNDVFAAYAIQLLFATGTNSASFVYRSHGVLPSDDAAYNSVLSMQIESSTYVDKIEGQFFRDNPTNANEYFGEIGLQIINPIRIISGELGKLQIVLTLKNPIANLVISANTMLSMRLHGVYGQAQG